MISFQQQNIGVSLRFPKMLELEKPWLAFNCQVSVVAQYIFSGCSAYRMCYFKHSKYLFLARLYGCTGRAIALPQTFSAAAALWTKCLSFTLKFLCDGQGALRRTILYVDRPCCVTSVIFHVML